VLLPLAYATDITSIVADGVTLTADDDYTLFNGRVTFKNGIGYPKDIVFTYTASSTFSEKIKFNVMKLLWIDYNNEDVSTKQSILKLLRDERVSGWL
jgi:hypothetical protein